MIMFLMSCWTFTNKCKRSSQELLICKINLCFWRIRNKQWLNESFKTSLSSRKMKERLVNHCWMIFSLMCLLSRLRFHQILTDWVSQLKLSQKCLTVLEIFLWFSNILDMIVIFSLDQLMRLIFNILFIQYILYFVFNVLILWINFWRFCLNWCIQVCKLQKTNMKYWMYFHKC